jgi:hypothetical protein
MAIMWTAPRRKRKTTTIASNKRQSPVLNLNLRCA